MSQNVPNEAPCGLTPAQERAIDLLVAGKTATVTAAEVGIDRRTLHRWRTEDARFIATLNAQRLELREAARARLMALVEPAINVVAMRLQYADVGTALHLLNGLRIIGPKADAEPIETDATVIAGELRERKMFAALKASM